MDYCKKSHHFMNKSKSEKSKIGKSEIYGKDVEYEKKGAISQERSHTLMKEEKENYLRRGGEKKADCNKNEVSLSKNKMRNL